MTETDKYYTPLIEDIRVGYEYEALIHYFTTGYEWEKKVLDLHTLQGILNTYRGKITGLRTPYLTKEQVEKEGWEGIEELDNFGAFTTTKNKSGIIYKLTWSSDLQLQIWDTNFIQCVFHGECKSINEFRYLCKLLGI